MKTKTKTTKRFENAIKKLYTAFHDGTLNAFSCKACAVGNLVGHNNWFMHSIDRGLTGSRLNFASDCQFQYPSYYRNDSGYNDSELLVLESVFLTEWVKQNSRDGKDKEIQFKSLCASIEYLAALDNISNPLDYSKLFEYDKDLEPKYELSL